MPYDEFLVSYNILTI